MKALLLLILSFFSFTFSEDVYIYQVDCANAQWLNGKKVCGAHQNDIYISIQSDLNYENYAVFKLSIQNVSNDSVEVNPAAMYVVRAFGNGHIDSVFVLNPSAKIEKANQVISASEEEIKNINKTRNTENAVISVVSVLPAIRLGNSKPINTSGTQISNTVYQEKINTLTNKLNQARQEKTYWETNALLATTIHPLNFVDEKIYMQMNHCTKATLHLRVGSNDFVVPIVYTKL